MKFTIDKTATEKPKLVEVRSIMFKDIDLMIDHEIVATIDQQRNELIVFERILDKFGLKVHNFK